MGCAMTSVRPQTEREITRDPVHRIRHPASTSMVLEALQNVAVS